MREIKFRAWDKEKKEMTTNFVMAPTSPDWGAFPIQHSLELEEIRKLLHKAFAFEPELRDRIDPDNLILSFTTSDYTFTDWANYYGLSNYIVMQYTGLKDKNGKEIYEGDLYQLPGLPLFEIKWVFDYQWGWNFAREDGEVIGNIYENPELLEVKE